MSDEYLLDLKSVHNRPKIKIDGRAYEIKSSDDFNISELAWFQVVGQEIKKQGQNFNEDSAKRLHELLTMAVDKIVIGLPEEVNSSLVDMQKIQIIQVFSKAVMPKAAAEKAANKEKKPTTESLSQSCNDFMEEPPKAG